MFKIIENKKAPYCKAYRCKNHRKIRDRFCAKHRARYTKENDEAAYVYWILKSNARRRKKKFTISLDYFRAWCDFTDYLKLRGRKAKDYSIDRQDPLKGYEPGNLRILKLGINSSKAYEDKQKHNEVPF